MSTRITVTSSPATLVDRAKRVQEANRAAQLQRAADDVLQTEAAQVVVETQDTRPRGGQPDTSVDRRPAAQRKAEGLAAAAVSTRYEGNTWFLKVETADGSASTEVSVADVRITEPNPPIPASTTDGFFPALIRHFISDPVDESTDRRTYTDKTSSVSVERDRVYVLPVGKDKCIVAYRLNRLAAKLYYYEEKISFYTTYESQGSCYQTTVNGVTGWYYPHSLSPDGQVLTNTSSITSYEKVNILNETGTRWVQNGAPLIKKHASVLCFLVSKTAVRQIDAPAQLRAWMATHHPALDLNKTTTVHTNNWKREYYAGYDTQGSTIGPPPYGDSNDAIGWFAFDYSVLAEDTSAITVDGFDPTLYTSDIDALASADKALPFHFGMGSLNSTNHYSSALFSPAMLSTVQGDVDLASSSLDSYAFMRQNYFGAAPNQYIGPCLTEGSCQTEDEIEFQSTRTTPTDTTTAVDGPYRTERGYTVKTGATGSLYYVWDWGQPSYCRQRLLALGFSATDL